MRPCHIETYLILSLCCIPGVKDELFGTIPSEIGNLERLVAFGISKFV